MWHLYLKDWENYIQNDNSKHGVLSVGRKVLVKICSSSRDALISEALLRNHSDLNIPLQGFIFIFGVIEDIVYQNIFDKSYVNVNFTLSNMIKTKEGLNQCCSLSIQVGLKGIFDHMCLSKVAAAKHLSVNSKVLYNANAAALQLFEVYRVDKIEYGSNNGSSANCHTIYLVKCAAKVLKTRYDDEAVTDNRINDLNEQLIDSNDESGANITVKMCDNTDSDCCYTMFHYSDEMRLQQYLPFDLITSAQIVKKSIATFSNSSTISDAAVIETNILKTLKEMEPKSGSDDSNYNNFDSICHHTENVLLSAVKNVGQRAKMYINNYRMLVVSLQSSAYSLPTITTTSSVHEHLPNTTTAAMAMNINKVKPMINYENIRQQSHQMFRILHHIVLVLNSYIDIYSVATSPNMNNCSLLRANKEIVLSSDKNMRNSNSNTVSAFSLDHPMKEVSEAVKCSVDTTKKHLLAETTNEVECKIDINRTAAAASVGKNNLLFHTLSNTHTALVASIVRMLYTVSTAIANVVSNYFIPVIEHMLPVPWTVPVQHWTMTINDILQCCNGMQLLVNTVNNLLSSSTISRGNNNNNIEINCNSNNNNNNNSLVTNGSIVDTVSNNSSAALKSSNNNSNKVKLQSIKKTKSQHAASTQHSSSSQSYNLHTVSSILTKCKMELVSCMKDHIDRAGCAIISYYEIGLVDGIIRQEWTSNSKYMREKKVTFSVVALAVSMRQLIWDIHRYGINYSRYNSSNDSCWITKLSLQLLLNILVHMQGSVYGTTTPAIVSVSKVRLWQWKIDQIYLLYMSLDTIAWILSSSSHQRITTLSSSSLPGKRQQHCDNNTTTTSIVMNQKMTTTSSDDTNNNNNNNSDCGEILLEIVSVVKYSMLVLFIITESNVDELLQSLVPLSIFLRSAKQMSSEPQKNDSKNNDYSCKDDDDDDDDTNSYSDSLLPLSKEDNNHSNNINMHESIENNSSNSSAVDKVTCYNDIMQELCDTFKCLFDADLVNDLLLLTSNYGLSLPQAAQQSIPHDDRNKAHSSLTCNNNSSASLFDTTADIISFNALQQQQTPVISKTTVIKNNTDHNSSSSNNRNSNPYKDNRDVIFSRLVQTKFSIVDMQTSIIQPLMVILTDKPTKTFNDSKLLNSKSISCASNNSMESFVGVCRACIRLTNILSPETVTVPLSSHSDRESCSRESCSSQPKDNTDLIEIGEFVKYLQHVIVTSLQCRYELKDEFPYPPLTTEETTNADRIRTFINQLTS